MLGLQRATTPRLALLKSGGRKREWKGECMTTEMTSPETEAFQLRLKRRLPVTRNIQLHFGSPLSVMTVLAVVPLR
jgi:hypothetical protein